jgi:hypothetical protein
MGRPTGKKQGTLIPAAVERNRQASAGGRLDPRYPRLVLGRARPQTASVAMRVGERCSFFLSVFFSFPPIGSEYDKLPSIGSALHVLGESIDEYKADKNGDENANENSSTIMPGLGTSDLWLPTMKSIRSETL